MTTLIAKTQDSNNFLGKLRKIVELAKASKLEVVDENGNTYKMENNNSVVVPKMIKDNTTIDTTAVILPEKIVAPAYQFKSPSNSNKFEETKAKYGFIPAAFKALQCNPVGLWYYDYATGLYKSKFINYANLDRKRNLEKEIFYKHIAKVMSSKVIYENILQYIPIIGTKFEHDDGLQFKCVFSSISNTKYALTAEYNNMILAVCCNVIDNNIIIKYGNNKKVQKEIIDFLEL